MFGGDGLDDTRLAAALDTLKLTLGMAAIANLILVVFVHTLFEETNGFCDVRAGAASRSFRFVLLVQLIVNAPSFLYFHKADKQAGNRSRQSLLHASFVIFLFALLLDMHLTLTTLFVGPLTTWLFATLVLASACVSFASFVCTIRFERQHIVLDESLL